MKLKDHVRVVEEYCTMQKMVDGTIGDVLTALYDNRPQDAITMLLKLQPVVRGVGLRLAAQKGIHP